MDADFSHLLASWFNPGLLDLRQVDWNSPASLLEKIIQHEAVHAIRDWSDLRRRLQQDRRCFAFFHPQLPGRAVDLRRGGAGGRDPALDRAADRRRPYSLDSRRPSVAAFYSISNSEQGLKGVSLGNFLIKRVAEELRKAVPSVKRYCTLSPVPRLRKWLTRVQGVPAAEALRSRHGADLERLDAAVRDGVLDSQDADRLYSCAAIFLSRHGASAAGDPVARFHLDNGARLERINLGADLSEKGLRESFGVMVNYLYDLSAVEPNHERFVRGEVVCSRQALSAARA